MSAYRLEPGGLFRESYTRFKKYRLWAWGYNGIGQLGIGNTTTQLAPVNTGQTNVVYLSAFYRNSIIVKSTDYDIYCSTGDNGNGQIGDETYTNKTVFTCVDLTPTVISGLSFPASKVTSGYQHTAAIRNDGSLWAWGYNGQGQLGDGTTTNKNYPVKVGSATNWVQVSGGYYHTAAVRSDGTLWTWGYNGYGQLGDGTTTNRSTPVQVPGTNWVKVDCGIYHTVALKSDGTLWAWGYNFYGQLGNGTTTNSAGPVQISSFSGWLNVSAGGYHTLAVKGDGSLWSWGYNGYGQLGDGTTADRAVPGPVSGVTANTIVDVSAGFNHSAVVLTNGSVLTWGYNGNGQLGNGTFTNSATAVSAAGISTAVEVEASENHTLIRLSNGTLRACGYNGNGALGDGTTTTRNTPVTCVGVSGALYIGTFYRTSGYIGSADPDLVCMTGDNANGQIGNETYIDKTAFTCIDLTPITVSNLSFPPSKVTGGYQHTAAIRADGSLWAWGYNGYGQLGDGTTTNKNYPVKVGTATNWVQVSSGYYHIMAIKSDGTLWGWGYNGYGQIGDGTVTNRSTPVQIGSATNWVKVECGIHHTAALNSDGTLYIWGYNGYGQIGDGTTTH